MNTNPDDPVTSELMTALKLNPVAIAEGDRDVGAQRISGGALDAFIGAGQLQANNTTNIFTDMGKVQVIEIFGGLQNNTLQMRFSADNGVSFGSAQSVGAATNSMYRFWVDLVSGRATGIYSLSHTLYSVTLTVPSGCNAIQLRAAQGTNATFFLLRAGGVALP
jgi:hypothetical protein